MMSQSSTLSIGVIRGTGAFEGWNGTKVVSTTRVLDRV